MERHGTGKRRTFSAEYKSRGDAVGGPALANASSMLRSVIRPWLRSFLKTPSRRSLKVSNMDESACRGNCRRGLGIIPLSPQKPRIHLTKNLGAVVRSVLQHLNVLGRDHARKYALE